MSRAPHRRFDFDQYLLLEQETRSKFEFLDGDVYAMSGGTPRHAELAANLIAALSAHVRGGPCRVYTSDLRIGVDPSGLYTYPDVSVVCGPPELAPIDREQRSVTNPSILVEVLSPSTEDYDRGEKLAHYQQIPSLREVVLVSQDTPRVDVWRRDEGGDWFVVTASGDESIALPSIGLVLPLAEIYR